MLDDGSDEDRLYVGLTVTQEHPSLPDAATRRDICAASEATTDAI